jgi:hypothetical protein
LKEREALTPNRGPRRFGHVVLGAGRMLQNRDV